MAQAAQNRSGWGGARKWGILLLCLLLVGAAIWQWRTPAEEQPKGKGKKGGVVPVVSAIAQQRDLPVLLSANGTVTALQNVEVRAQINATIKSVHIREGQFVRKGERLFSLDTRTEAANLNKAEAQIVKVRGDLATAERNLQRQRDLFQQKFISQAALDASQNQVDSLRGQLAIDEAARDASRVALSYGEITAPIAGRSGAIAVFPGSLVQPTGAALVNITQVDPIMVSFTLPEQALAALLKAQGQGGIKVNATLETEALQGRLVFIDNAVDAGSGTIRLKAEFRNSEQRLWPGQFVQVNLAPQTLHGVVTVPVQAVQTGPEKKIVYVIGEEMKVRAVPVTVRLIQDGMAVVEGIEAGVKVVAEGAQNLRPGSQVTEAKPGEPGKGKKGKGKKKSEQGADQAKPAQ